MQVLCQSMGALKSLRGTKLYCYNIPNVSNKELTYDVLSAV